MGNYLLEGSADPAGKLISAADTADIHQSLAAGHPQQGAAGGTFEEAVGFALGKAVEKALYAAEK